jgi:hypothetical protein
MLPPTIPTARPAGPKSTPANDEAVATVVLDEGDLVDPGDISDRVEHVGVCVVGAFGTAEHRQREIEAHGAVLRARGLVGIIPIV